MGLAQGFDLGAKACMAIEHAQLRLWIRQGLVGMLAMNVDQLLAQLFELS